MGRRKHKDGEYRHSSQVGFSGDGRNMRAGGKVGCRVVNCFAPVYYKRQLDEYALVPILHGLDYYDTKDPYGFGSFDRVPRHVLTDHSKPLRYAIGWDAAS